MKIILILLLLFGVSAFGKTLKQSVSIENYSKLIFINHKKENPKNPIKNYKFKIENPKIDFIVNLQKKCKTPKTICHIFEDAINTNIYNGYLKCEEKLCKEILSWLKQNQFTKKMKAQGKGL